MGRWKAADSLVNWQGCDFDPATDYLQLTAGARLVDAKPRGDTVDVTIEYTVFGRAWSYYPRGSADKNWRFAPEQHTDTVVLTVVPAALGQPPVACGEYQPNHVGVSRMTNQIAKMDDSSRVALMKARATKVQ